MIKCDCVYLITELLFSPRGKIKKATEAAGDEQQPGRSCHNIIALLLKLGADQIAYINPTDVLQSISHDPSRIVLLLSYRFFSSSHTPGRVSELMQIELFYPVYSGK